MMKTKYLFMLLVACFLGMQVVNAQRQQSQKDGRKRMTMEQMAEMKCRRIIQDLGLDDAKAAKFSDVYKKYMKEMNDVRKENGPKKLAVKSEKPEEPKIPTDAEVEQRMKKRFAQSRKILDIREKYYDEFRLFLSPKQVEKVYNEGQMDHGKFKKELNRRAGVKTKK